MGKPVLTYFKGRGRGEAIRLMLAAAGVEFDEAEHLSKPEQMDNLKKEGKLKFGQAPLLHMDGMDMVQTMATVRYIARKHGFAGSSPEEEFRIDMLSEGARDFCAPMMGWMFGDNEALLKNLQANIFPKYLGIFENELASNKCDFIAGSKVTMADIMLLESLLTIEDISPKTLEQYPKLTDLMKRLKAIPSMAAYLSGPQRYPLNDAAYIQRVKTTLRW